MDIVHVIPMQFLRLPGLAVFPIRAHLLDLLLVVELGVVVLADAAQALVER